MLSSMTKLCANPFLCCLLLLGTCGPVISEIILPASSSPSSIVAHNTTNDCGEDCQALRLAPEQARAPWTTVTPEQRRAKASKKGFRGGKSEKSEKGSVDGDSGSAESGYYYAYYSKSQKSGKSNFEYYSKSAKSGKSDKSSKLTSKSFKDSKKESKGSYFSDDTVPTRSPAAQTRKPTRSPTAATIGSRPPSRSPTNGPTTITSRRRKLTRRPTPGPTSSWSPSENPSPTGDTDNRVDTVAPTAAKSIITERISSMNPTLMVDPSSAPSANPSSDCTNSLAPFSFQDGETSCTELRSFSKRKGIRGCADDDPAYRENCPVSCNPLCSTPSPSAAPSEIASASPSRSPSVTESVGPTTMTPSVYPSSGPSVSVTNAPSESLSPSGMASANPTANCRDNPDPFFFKGEETSCNQLERFAPRKAVSRCENTDDLAYVENCPLTCNPGCSTEQPSGSPSAFASTSPSSQASPAPSPSLSVPETTARNCLNNEELFEWKSLETSCFELASFGTGQQYNRCFNANTAYFDNCPRVCDVVCGAPFDVMDTDQYATDSPTASGGGAGAFVTSPAQLIEVTGSPTKSPTVAPDFVTSPAQLIEVTQSPTLEKQGQEPTTSPTEIDRDDDWDPAFFLDDDIDLPDGENSTSPESLDDDGNSTGLSDVVDGNFTDDFTDDFIDDLFDEVKTDTDNIYGVTTRPTTRKPSRKPTRSPTVNPTRNPTRNPSENPSQSSTEILADTVPEILSNLLEEDSAESSSRNPSEIPTSSDFPTGEVTIDGIRTAEPTYSTFWELDPTGRPTNVPPTTRAPREIVIAIGGDAPLSLNSSSVNTTSVSDQTRRPDRGPPTTRPLTAPPTFTDPDHIHYQENIISGAEKESDSPLANQESNTIGSDLEPEPYPDLPHPDQEISTNNDSDSDSESESDVRIINTRDPTNSPTIIGKLWTSNEIRHRQRQRKKSTKRAKQGLPKGEDEEETNSEKHARRKHQRQENKAGEAHENQQEETNIEKRARRKHQREVNQESETHKDQRWHNRERRRRRRQRGGSAE